MITFCVSCKTLGPWKDVVLLTFSKDLGQVQLIMQGQKKMEIKFTSVVLKTTKTACYLAVVIIKNDKAQSESQWHTAPHVVMGSPSRKLLISHLKTLTCTTIIKLSKPTSNNLNNNRTLLSLSPLRLDITLKRSFYSRKCVQA